MQAMIVLLMKCVHALWTMGNYGHAKTIMGQGVNIELAELVDMPKVDVLTVQVK